MRSYLHREWRPAKSHVVWRSNSAPRLAAASPAKPGCWAHQLPAPGNSYLIEMQSRATASGSASPLEGGESQQDSSATTTFLTLSERDYRVSPFRRVCAGLRGGSGVLSRRV